MNQTVVINRIQKIQNVLKSNKIDGFLVSSVYNISYLTGLSCFSTEEREAFVLVTQAKIYLFADARNVGTVKNQAPFLTLAQLSAKEPLGERLIKIAEREKLKTLGFEPSHLTVSEYNYLRKHLLPLRILFRKTGGFVEKIKLKKSPEEIDIIQKACRIDDEAFSFIQKKIKPGISEKQLKFELETYIRESGASLAFSSIVAFGKNSAIPHHVSGDSILKSSDVVLLDFGAKWDSYCSDMTRTVFVGTPSEKLQKMYETTLSAQHAVIESANKALKQKEAANLFQVADKKITENKFPPLPHGLGHGVGLEVHEAPSFGNKELKLEKGMVVTIEPGIYLEEFGGIRIEDTFSVEENILVQLTKSQKELTIL